MSGRSGPPPPPPKRKNRQPTNGLINLGAAGAAHNVARILSGNNNLKHENKEDSIHQNTELESKEKKKICNISELPDTVIGNGVEIHGELQFDSLLRINGKFEGKLLSKGNLIIGETGTLVTNVNTISRMIVEGGKVIGNIIVDELLLLNYSVVIGDITCKLLEVVGPNVSIVGNINVHRKAPALFIEKKVENKNNNISKIDTVDSPIKVIK
jgi:cytoskeletal protein CcmA (bactofilin family)